MRFPMTVLRVVTLAPALLASLVLTVVVCALLPPALGLVVFMATAGVLVALALGQLQEPAIAAPGQACVLYDGERVLGGGFIRGVARAVDSGGQAA